MARVHEGDRIAGGSLPRSPASTPAAQAQTPNPRRRQMEGKAPAGLPRNNWQRKIFLALCQLCLRNRDGGRFRQLERRLLCRWRRQPLNLVYFVWIRQLLKLAFACFLIRCHRVIA